MRVGRLCPKAPDGALWQISPASGNSWPAGQAWAPDRSPPVPPPSGGVRTASTSSSGAPTTPSGTCGGRARSGARESGGLDRHSEPARSGRTSRPRPVSRRFWPSRTGGLRRSLHRFVARLDVAEIIGFGHRLLADPPQRPCLAQKRRPVRVILDPRNK